MLLCSHLPVPSQPCRAPRGSALGTLASGVCTQTSARWLMVDRCGRTHSLFQITVWKRYSDFRKLHQDLWQIHRSLYQQPELFPPFAKAKVFGRFDQSVIEERRQCSEDLLQFSANIPALYSSQYIEDFFKGGEVHDGSELIGPPEPLSDFLADSWSDCSSEVQKDVGGADESTTASHSEYGGVSSDSDLISLLLDTDSLADVDDGMASDGDSPNRPPRGVSPSPLPSLPDDCQDAEVSRASRAALFPSALRSRAGKKDYLERASEQIRQAVQREGEQDYQAAFSFYRSGVDLLLQGVQGDPSPTRREAVKKKTAEYLMRAEQISTQYLRDGSEPGPVPSLALGALGSRPTWKQRNPAEELKVFRVLGVIDKVLLVMDKRSQETFILKGLRKSSECGGNKKTVIPRCVPNMVCLHKYIVSEDAVFLVLQHAEGGKLWSHIGKFLNKSPEDSLDIPFIQKSHTTAVHTVECPVPEELSSGSVDSGPNREGVTLGVLPLKSSLTPSSQDDSSTQDEEGADSSQRVLLDSGATSEEECTNSYLALCNEYEQEKIEPDSLEEGPTPVAEETASHSQPLLSSDSLGSPSMAQEFCFFTEDDHSEVFSPSRFPANPLDQSKKTPMELFRIDSRDSASELLGMDSGDRLRFEPSKPDLEEVTEVIGKGPQMDLWGFDSDRGSNESVPVISFKEAIVDDTGSCDEGRPPDLLVNLPGVADSSAEELVSAGASSTDDARMSPGFGKPDVLQLHYDLGHDAVLGLSEDEGDPSSVCTEPTYMGDGAAARGGRPLSSSPHEYGGPPSSPGFRKALATFSEELPAVHGGFHAAPEVARSELRSERETHDRIAAEALGDSASVEVDAGKADSDVSQLFKDLDDLLLIASNVHLPEEHVQRWAVQMIVALDALHQEGIICRDLNPNNILLDDRGHIQLTYFCSWSEVEDSYDQEAVSAMYCAPEVGSISEETAACDWWSLGAILFELLTGKSLRQCHPAGISRHTMLNVPDFVSEEAKSLLQQLLQFNPVERLGAGVAGVEDIKSHPFFATVIWPK